MKNNKIAGAEPIFGLCPFLLVRYQMLPEGTNFITIAPNYIIFLYGARFVQERKHIMGADWRRAVNRKSAEEI